MTEYEKKLLLTEDEYRYLMKHFGHKNPFIQKNIFTQINYYFDTDDFSMNRQNKTCRIRLKDGKYKVTVKKHSLGTDHSTETEMEMYTQLDSNVFTNMGLKLQGKLITHRCVVMKEANWEVVLDKNEYLGQTDYELEIEYKSEYQEVAQSILNNFRDMLMRHKHSPFYENPIADCPSIPSKSARFFDKLSNIKAEKQNSISEKDNSNITA